MLADLCKLVFPKKNKQKAESNQENQLIDITVILRSISGEMPCNKYPENRHYDPFFSSKQLTIAEFGRPFPN